MKKLLSIGLLVLYLPFSIGALISFRYCQGSLDKIAILKTVNNCCPSDVLEKSCCKHTFTLAKINAVYDSHSSAITVPYESTGVAQHLAWRAVNENGKPKKAFAYPLLISTNEKSPIYLINRVLII